MRLKQLLLGAGAVLLAAGAAAYVFRAELAVAAASRVAERHLSTTGLEGLPDGLHVGLCGAGSPFPDERRGGPCTLVLAGERLLVFDAGSGATRRIGQMGFQAGRIQAIFLTHFHSDHFDGLGELMLQRWVQGVHQAPVPVFGPRGVEKLVDGLMTAYEQDRGYRVAHHGMATIPPGGFGGEPQTFEAPKQGRITVLRDGELEVSAFNVQHSPVHPAVGYRIDYKGRSVVISGDTTRSDAVAQAAQGVDLLLHDALSLTLVDTLGQAAQRAGRANLHKVFADITDYHATPEQAADTARQAGVRTLVLHHIVPALPPLPGLEKAFLGGAPGRFDGPLHVGLDGDLFSLPAGSTTVTHSRRF